MNVRPPVETTLHDVWRIGDVFLVRAYGEWFPATSDQVLRIGKLRKLLLERAGFVLTWTQSRLDDFLNDHLHVHLQAIPHQPEQVCNGDEIARLTEAWCTEYEVDRGAIEAYFKHIE